MDGVAIKKTCPNGYPDIELLPKYVIGDIRFIGLETHPDYEKCAKVVGCALGTKLISGTPVPPGAPMPYGDIVVQFIGSGGFACSTAQMACADYGYVEANDPNKICKLVDSNLVDGLECYDCKDREKIKLYVKATVEYGGTIDPLSPRHQVITFWTDSDCDIGIKYIEKAKDASGETRERESMAMIYGGKDFVGMSSLACYPREYSGCWLGGEIIGAAGQGKCADHEVIIDKKEWKAY